MADTQQGGAAFEARAAGVALAGSAALAVFAMAHHPTGLPAVGGATGPGTLTGFLHGAMIVLITLQLWGYMVFMRMRGGAGWAVAGFAAYVLGFAANLVAALVSGFLAPALASNGVADAGDLALLREVNQLAAKLAVLAGGAAILMWSAGLLTGGGHKVSGVTGLGLGVLPAALILTGAVTMDVAGAQLTYGLQMGFAAIAGVLVWRGRA